MKKKTDVISIRVNANIKNRLNAESDSKNLTLNSLISQIISEHVELGSLYNDVGFVAVGKSFLESVLGQISDYTLKEIASTSGKNTFKDASVYLHGSFDVNSIIKTLDSWCNVSHIPFRTIEKSTYYRYVIRHQLGSKWTLYFEALIKSIFLEFDKKPKNFVKTTYSLSFQLDK